MRKNTFKSHIYKVSKCNPKVYKTNLNYIKATMSYENLDLPDDIVKIISDNMRGKNTNQEARNMVLKKHGLI